MGANLFEVMEKITGIPTEEQKKIFEGVQENHRKLNSCKCHDFSIELPGPTKLNPKWKCKNCGGVVESIEKKYYEQGFQHAKEMMNHED